MTDSTETAEEPVVFDPFTSPAAVKTVVLAAVYTDTEGTEHEADTKIELDRDVADDLLFRGKARTVELDEQLRADREAAEKAAAPAKPPTIKAVLDEVGDDPAKATEALAAEKAGENRPTLVSKLEAIANTGGN